jgi:hypothetical protein
MSSIAVFAPLIVKSFRKLNEEEEPIIENISDDLKVKTLKEKNIEKEEKINEELKKVKRRKRKGG